MFAGDVGASYGYGGNGSGTERSKHLGSGTEAGFPQFSRNVWLKGNICDKLWIKHYKWWMDVAEMAKILCGIIIWGGN